MKKYYKIKEIADLYGIQPDSLRYYESVGLIHPKRSKANYRLYSYSDIWRLNIIRDCLRLGYDTNQIKEYLDTRTVLSTVGFLVDETEIVRDKIKELQDTLTSLEQRIHGIQAALDLPLYTFQTQYYPLRHAKYLKDTIDEEDKVDYLLTKLSESTPVLGFLNSGSIIENGEYTSVFIVTEVDYDFYLRPGEYCTYTYRGNYHDAIMEMTNWIQRHGYVSVGPFYEFLLIDKHETCLESEYLSQLQVQIKKAPD